MCYILEPMRAEVSRRVAMGVSSPRLCAKIHRANGETCTLFHEARLTKAEADERIAVHKISDIDRGVVYE